MISGGFLLPCHVTGHSIIVAPVQSKLLMHLFGKTKLVSHTVQSNTVDHVNARGRLPSLVAQNTG